MTEAAQAHPCREVLEAFGLGTLAEEAASEVESHLAGCTACCLAVENTAADAFIGLVRSTQLPGSPLPARVPRQAQPATTPMPRSGPPIRLSPPADLDSAAASPRAVVVPADLVNHPRYRILGLLGEGGMGAVYKAEHRLMQRRVALKTIAHDFSARPELVERFRREVKAAARLSHPNIVAVHDAEQAGRTHLLVMEYVEGTDLARLVKERGALPVAEACGYVRQAALGLQHAHEMGMIHRDIKPHNLMVTPGRTVKILDFGLARLASEATGPCGEVTAAGVVMGTPDYMAPEQAGDARQADVRADIYGLGCTLYQLLASRVPFPEGTVLGKVLRHATEAPTPLGELRPDVPPELVRVVERMMSKKPEHRYQTPAEVAAALAPFTRDGAMGVEPAGGPANAFSAAGLPEQEGSMSVAIGGCCTGGTASATAGTRRRRVSLDMTVVLLIAAAVLLAVSIIRIQTAKGTLEIRTDDPDVKVTVRQNGKVVVELKGETEIRLKEGEYELALPAGKKGLELDRVTITLKRGGKETVRIKRTRDLSDMDEFDVRVAEGRFAKKGKLGFGEGDPRYAFGRIRVRGKESPNGIAMHPPDNAYGRVKYRLDNKARIFLAAVALDDSAGGPGLAPGVGRIPTPVTFKVLGDGKVLWKAKPVDVARKVQDCRVDVRGVSVLELRVDCPGSRVNAYAVWVEPRVEMK